MKRDQLGLFGGGDREKAAGIARVTSRTPDWYRAEFIAAVMGLALGTEFTSEDITTKIGMPPIGCHPSAVGALINGLARQGFIRKAGRRVKAQRTNQHSAELEVWIRSDARRGD